MTAGDKLFQSLIVPRNFVRRMVLCAVLASGPRTADSPWWRDEQEDQREGEEQPPAAHPVHLSHLYR
jgi:hypothetical protein